MIKINSKLVFDFDNALDKLSDAVGEKTLRAAGFAGAAVFRDETIARVPVDTGLLKSQLIVKRIEEKSQDAAVQTYYVVVRNGPKKTITKGKKRVANSAYDKTKDAFYWRFVEYGTSKMAAQPFIRPSFDAKKGEAMQAMKSKLSEKISEALRS